MDVLDAARLVVGLVLVLLAPGLAWSYVLLPGRRGPTEPSAGLDAVQRGCLAVGLSIALVPLLVFILGVVLRMPLTPLTATLSIAALTLVPIGILMVRRRRTTSRPNGT